MNSLVIKSSRLVNKCFGRSKICTLFLLFFSLNASCQLLDSLLQGMIMNGHYPGVSLSVYDCKTSSFQNVVAGWADLEQQTVMTPNHRLMSGSTGKTFVAAIIMQLIEERKISMNQLIWDYFKDTDWFERLPNHKTITVKNLLQHQSGLKRYVFDEEFSQQVHVDPDRIWRAQELISYVLDEEPLFESGQSFAYSDTNFILIGMIIEKIEGKPYYQVLRERILEPFELTEILPTNTRKISNLAQGYMGEQDPLGFHGTMLEDGIAKYNLQFEWAGGGLAFKTSDYARWLGLLFEGLIFNWQLLGSTYMDIVDAPELKGKYGIGFQVFDLPNFSTGYGHSGFFPGYYTLGIYFPKEQKVIAMQINSTQPECLKYFFGDFIQLTIQALKL